MLFIEAEFVREVRVWRREHGGIMETHPRRTAGLAPHQSSILYFLMPEGYLFP